jgi:prenyl protein peptidase
VTFSTIVCAILTVYVFYEHDVPLPMLFKLLGLWPVSLFDTARTMLLVIILFAGPLFEHGVVDGAFKNWIRLREVHEVLSSWIGYRNFIVVSLISESSWCLLTVV